MSSDGRSGVGDPHPTARRLPNAGAGASPPHVTTDEFFATNPVFSLDEATRVLAPPGGRRGTVERLKHHVASGRLRIVTRGVYAVVPPGVSDEAFQPDPILVAAAARPDAVFSYHTALELLGAAHSVWNECTLFTARRRRPVTVGVHTIHFLDHPGPLRTAGTPGLGTRTAERRARMLQITGPERSLIEGLHRPGRVGGLEELVNSASGFPVLDLDLLKEILGRYGLARLWAASGWFLERFQASFHVPDQVLDSFEERVPRAAQYLERSQRGGILATRWNLILPESVRRLAEPDER